MAEVLLVVRLQGAKEAQAAVDKLTGSLGDQTKEVDRTSEANKRLGSSMGGVTAVGGNMLRNVIAPLLALLSGKVIVEAANDFRLFEGRLKTVTESSEELAATQEALFQISQKTGTSYANNLDVFARFARASETIGLDNQQVLQLTENINKVIVISGEAAESANAALVQLAQGFASGEVRGEELRSVMEQMAPLAKLVADQLGLTIGQLRELSFAGKITAEDWSNAITASTSEIEAEFDKMGDAGSRAWTRVTNALFELTGRISEATLFIDGMAISLNAVAGFVEDISDLVLQFEHLDRITLGTVTDAFTTLFTKVASFRAAGYLDILAAQLEALAKGFEFFGADDFAAGIRSFGDALSGVADDLGEEDHSIVDALIPPTAAEQVERRLDKAFQARLVALANEKLAEEDVAKRREQLQADLAAGAEKAAEQERKAREKLLQEKLKLEEDWLNFHASINTAALDDVREYWRQRLLAAEDGTRDELEALQKLADINKQMAQLEIDAITDSTTLTKAEQQERLQTVRDSFAAQAAAAEDGSLRFGLALGVIDEALASNRDSLASTTTAVQSLADRFNDGFITVPDAVFGALTGVRTAFRGLFEDVFTLSKSIGDALRDFFGNVANAILSNLAQVIADAAFQKIFGSLGGSTGGGSGLLGTLTDFLGGFLSFATGGSRVVTKPTLMLAGERGPERATFTPLGRGRVFPRIPRFATGGSRVVTRPTLMIAGDRGPERASFRPLASGVSAPSFSFRSGARGPRGFSGSAPAGVTAMQTGGSRVVTRPTLFMAGETGAERASFQPIARGGGTAGGGGGMGGVTVSINAPAFFGGDLGAGQLERHLGRAIFERTRARRTR